MIKAVAEREGGRLALILGLSHPPYTESDYASAGPEISVRLRAALAALEGE